jgi:hypothetical protein
LRKRIDELKEALRIREDELDSERTTTRQIERLADDLRAELSRTRAELDYFSRLNAQAKPSTNTVSLSQSPLLGLSHSSMTAVETADLGNITGSLFLTERAASCGIGPLGVDFGALSKRDSTASAETMGDSTAELSLRNDVD